MHNPARRKDVIKFAASGILAIVLVIVVIVISLSPSANQPRLGSCSIAGYTNQSGTNMVLLRVTNESRLRLVCFVEPPMIVTKNGDLKLKDVYPAAPAVVMSPHQTFTFIVPRPADTNQFYVCFDLQETEFGLSHARQVMIKLLRSTGLPVFRPKHCHLQSPPFGKGE